MPDTLVSTLARRVSRLAELMGAAEVEAQWKGKRAAYLWQGERDLELLTRHVGWARVAAAYRESLRNPAEAWGAAYELRTAAKLAPVVDDIELRPPIGIIVFGSLASRSPADDVHDASDIDLAVIKATKARFVDRVREAVDLVEPRLGLNLFVYTPEEIVRARASGPSFIRDEVLARGKTLYPVDG